MTESRTLDYDHEVFEPVPRSRNGKIRCRVCGAIGYPNEEWNYGTTWVTNPAWWGYAHVRGHGWDCSDCERAFTSSHGLYMHRRKAHR